MCEETYLLGHRRLSSLEAHREKAVSSSLDTEKSLLQRMSLILLNTDLSPCLTVRADLRPRAWASNMSRWVLYSCLLFFTFNFPVTFWGRLGSKPTQDPLPLSSLVTEPWFLYPSSQTPYPSLPCSWVGHMATLGQWESSRNCWAGLWGMFRG